MDELENILECRATPMPVQPDPRANNQGLRLKYNICYIVAGVIFKGDKVLLIQEAKPSCKGSWYLPAGRMEPNETIVDAVKREVLEESGLTFEPEAILAVEYQSQYWVRITLTGEVTGGCLKTTEQADKESLQANWFSRNDIAHSICLRATDILPLIGVGIKRAEGEMFKGLPVEMGHVSTSLRLIITHQDTIKNEMSVLTHSKGQGSTVFPNCGVHEVDRMIKSSGFHGDYKVCGVISLEHVGRPHGRFDGMCVSVLVEAMSRDLDTTTPYSWSKVEGNLRTKVTYLMENSAQLLFI